MYYLHEYNKRLDNYKDSDDLLKISEDLVNKKLVYAYPYQLKEFIIRYAECVCKEFKKSDHQMDKPESYKNT